MMIKGLMDVSIQPCENGFIVREGSDQGFLNRMWVFESGESLANFIAGWAEGEEIKSNE